MSGLIGILIGLNVAGKPKQDLIEDERSKRRVINEILFLALMGPVFAIASVLYVWTYHRYEKEADENQD